MSEITSKSLINRSEQIRKESNERKKIILYLIRAYLIEHHLNQTVESLDKETHLNGEYQICDNIDLDIILQEYKSYHYVKFSREAKFLRKIESVDNQKNDICINNNLKKNKSIIQNKNNQNNQEKFDKNFQDDLNNCDFELNIKSLSQIPNDLDYQLQFSNIKLPLPSSSSHSDKEFIDQISKVIITKDNCDITFDHCVGLDKSIESLKEAIIYPIIYPNLFKNLTPWKGILLYGPPGTGKTLLAKALVNESIGPLINVSSSTFISKWRGDSEKMLKSLFDLGNINNGTTIFIDEIDSLISDCLQHEASKRFKSELLTQIDGIITNKNNNNNLFILATTNSPWNIDLALLRRFEKRILIPLPNHITRIKIFKFYFNKYGHHFILDDIEKFAKLTDKFTGSDINILCKEIEMMLVREMIKNTNQAIKRQPTVNDVLNIINTNKPTINNYEKYIKWHEKYGTI